MARVTRLRATVDGLLDPLRRYRMHAYYVAMIAVGLLGVVGSQWGGPTASA